ncbi:MAG: D-alanine--D-alanine ligase [Ruminococcaceae bacterium]|nr:D-alanine--D-alanine ligase [Oscillospiraceae bacterium]
MDRKDLKIVVIYGGMSSEREVSLRSGVAVAESLRRGGYREVALFDLTRESVPSLLSVPMDVAFLALHGEGGEDGCIQGMLELAGIPYTGSSVQTSAVCMDKIRTKELLAYRGIPTPRFAVKHRDECIDREAVARELTESVGLPMVLKSPCQGSSIGVVMVKKESELLSAMEEVFRYGDRLLAEEFVSGTELTLPILGNRELTVLPTVEITSEREFYDYRAKYTQGLCHHIIPARIPSEAEQRVRRVGEQAYRILGCEGLARIDFIWNETQGPMLIEVNTLPGMTEMSLFPDSARFAGVSFEELTDRMIALAWEKAKETETENRNE